MDKWDTRYLRLAREVATWSKDPSSKIGAVCIGVRGQVLSTGYNGFPRRITDDEHRLNDRPTKYKLVVHAEKNAIYNATYNGVSLDGATMYVSGLPCCSECAKGIIQVGIRRVIMEGDPFNERWRESVELTIEMFKEAGIEYEFITPSE
jgi:dCMP deaminase